MAKTKEPLELTLEQIETIRLLETGEPIEGFIFERKLQGDGEHILYTQGRLKRNYNLETGEFYEYTSKARTKFHTPVESVSPMISTSRIQHLGRNHYNKLKK